ncbi:PKD domain-containing protein [Owenweeksia hongkongensis]|uniref:PKD domain-containing protein n=1 Tax=Owenweeksia hongkongensis TaxID=253245 RepID=UPI003A905FDB
MNTKTPAFLLALIFSIALHSQTKSVLFIGNSYTGVNNLPQLTKDVALSVGDTFLFDSHTPGGAQMQQHASNATAIQKVFSQPWDHVVLQAQSQEPSFGQAQVQQSVYPYAEILCDTMRANDSCTRPIFYRTWGRKNGDASNCAVAPWLCSYEGMDSALAFSYSKMANDNDAFLSPVGDVWKYIRANYPSINLYAPDESHPSLEGSYAAACTFYAIIFQKDPSLITHDATLNAAVAQNIRAAAKLVVYDSLLNWNVGKFKPVADFVYMQANGCTVHFDASSSINANSYVWDFGDGTDDTGVIVSHTYSSGTYTPTLVASKCGHSDTTDFVVFPCTFSLNELSAQKPNLIYPNPAHDMLNLENLDKWDITQIKVVDIQGKTILTYIDDIPNSIDISSLPKGTYSVQFITKYGDLYSQTFVKE